MSMFLDGIMPSKLLHLFLRLFLFILNVSAHSYGSFEISHDSFAQQLPVELKANGKIYLTQTTTLDPSMESIFVLFP